VGPCDRDRYLCGRLTERGVHGTRRPIEMHVMTKRDGCAGSYGRERCMHCQNKCVLFLERDSKKRNKIVTHKSCMVSS
jgi:hypothetical protein